MEFEYIVVASEADPVARLLLQAWGTPPSIGSFVDGGALRRLGPNCLLLRRPGPHIHDERLDQRLPAEFQAGRVPLVFPSIHRSERGIPALTVHPLGNPGASAELGGRGRTLVPTAPALMTATLRTLREEGTATGLPVTFEATHHGPELHVPAFFVEIGYPLESEPPPLAVQLLAGSLVDLSPDSGDRIALAVGGGHYAPHFTDLALRRRWAFGHILSRHALEEIDATTARTALRETPGAEGVLFSRAEDAKQPIWSEVGRRLKDAEAPARPSRG